MERVVKVHRLRRVLPIWHGVRLSIIQNILIKTQFNRKDRFQNFGAQLKEYQTGSESH